MSQQKYTYRSWIKTQDDYLIFNYNNRQQAESILIKLIEDNIIYPKYFEVGMDKYDLNKLVWKRLKIKKFKEVSEQNELRVRGMIK
jgi:hypothetical protein